MKLCTNCNGYGWYAGFTGNICSGIMEQIQEQCERCEGFGHEFESPEEKGLFCVLTTEEEREGYFAKKEENSNQTTLLPKTRF